MTSRDLPPNWPQAVWVPGTPDWEASATRWLLEQVPPEYRRYDVLRRYPVLLARFAGDHTNASLEAARTGWRSLRVALGDLLPAEALDAAMDAYEREGSRLAAMVGSIEVVSAALRGLAIDLAKICEDLLLMSSGPRTGFAEIRLPAKQPGSSIMPGKVNPVMVENLAMIAYHVVGNDTAVAWAASRGQLELNVMMPLIAHEVLEAGQVLTSGCRQFARECVAGIEADVEHCAELLEQSSAMATPLAPYIGYALAASIAKEAVASGRTIRELVLEKGIFDQEALDVILDPFELTEPGVAGGFRYEPKMPEGYERPTGPVGAGG